MKSGKRLSIVVAVFLMLGAITLCMGCPFSPDVDQIRDDFCRYYPEVCQYVDFDSDSE